MPIQNYILLIAALLTGGSAAFYFRNNTQQYLQLILSFSGAYILGITALHLIPETFYAATPMLGAWLLLGFVGQLALEQLSMGIEHGHVHAPHHADFRFVVQVMLGLSIHSFVEGMPLTSTMIDAQQHGHNHNHLLWGIILHEMPASFALVSLLLLAGFRKTLVVFCLVCYAMMSTLGALTSEYLAPTPEKSQILMAIVIGTFLHIATTILYEADSSKQHSVSFKKLAVIALGLGVAFLTLV